MITKRDKMIGKTNKLQLLPQKILPKKPSITNSANQSTIFDDTFPGEFHTSWEHDLWGVDVIPEDIDLDGLDHFTHGLANEEPQLSSDPMLSEVIEENSLHLNQASQNNTHENETVLLEMIVDNADIPLPQGALVLANSLGNESIEEISQNSVDFNDTSESGFDDSFCGWDPSSMMDSNSYDQEQDNTHEDLLQTALTETFPQQRLHTEQQDFTKSDLYSSQMTESNQKKRVGRPRKTLVHTVASVPVRGSKKLIETMKRRRQRDLNNIASQKCRAKKKAELLNEEKECEFQAQRNKELISQEKFLRERVERLRKILKRNGYCLPDLAAASAGL